MITPNTSTVIRGRGKGGGSGDVRTPREASNSQRSRSIVHLVDLISEGPVQGFATAAGIDCIDCELKSKPVIVDGAVTLPTLQITGDSSGYPFNLDFPIYAYVDGDGTDCVIRVDVWPRNDAEKVLFLQKFGGTFNETNTPIRPEGKVCRVVIVNGGKDYTSVTVTIPPSSWQATLFDNVALASPVDLKLAFNDVRVAYRNGTADQTHMPGFEYVQEIIDTPELDDLSKKDLPNGHIIQIDGENYDRLVVNFTFPGGLYRTNKVNGDIEELNDNYAVRVRITQRYRATLTGTFGSEQPFGDEFYTITGKSMSPFQKSFEGRLIKESGVEGHFWQIILRRLTDDDATRNPLDSQYRTTSTVGFSNATAYTDVKLTYPNSFIVGLILNADQFSTLPKRAYRVKLLKWPCPTNYFPPYSMRPDGTMRLRAEYNRAVVNGAEQAMIDSLGRPIDQLWDGTYYNCWTNNPAYIFAGVCSEQRIGLGQFLPGVANKWEIYKIARRCDEVVKNGYRDGSYAYEEARFTCNTYIQERTEAYAFLSDLASTMRGIIYWAAGKVMLVQDHKNAPKRLRLNPTDFKKDTLDYPGTGRKARNTVAIVQFNDPERNYDLQPAIYEDYEGIKRYGVRIKRFTRFACTSKSEARRAAKLAILDEQINTDTLVGTLGIKGTLLAPGDLFDMDNPLRSDARFGGRIVAISADELGNALLTTDTKIEPDVLATDLVQNYRLLCVMPVGELKVADVTSIADIDKLNAAQTSGELLVRSFSTDPNGRLIVKINGPLPGGVVVGTTFALQSTVFIPQTFRVLSSEKIGKHEYNLLAVQWTKGMLDAVDNDDPFYEQPFTPDLDAWRVVSPPTDLVLYVNQKREQGVLVYDLEISWTKPAKGFSAGYEVYLGKGLANPQFVSATTAVNVRIRLPEASAYQVEVYNVGLNGRRSQPLRGSVVVGTLEGENAEVISGLELTGQGNNVEFFGAGIALSWRVNWSGAPTNFEQGVPPVLPPGVVNYKVQLRNGVTNDLLLEENVTNTGYTLNADANRALVGGPYRDIICQVQARTVDGALSAPAAIRVFNALPDAPIYTVNEDANGNAVIAITSQRVSDFKAYAVWVSTTPGFTALPSLLRYQGDASLITIPLDIGVQHYVRVGEMDQLMANPSEAVLGVEQSVTTTALARLSVFDFSQSQLR